MDHELTIQERQEGYEYAEVYRAFCHTCGWFSQACNTPDQALDEATKHEQELE